MWDVWVSRFKAPSETDPNYGDRTTPNHFDQATGLSSGGALSFGDGTLMRTTVKANLTQYRTGFAGGDHELKAGAQIEQGKHDAFNAWPGGVQYTDNAGQPSQAVFRQPLVTGGEFMTAGAYVMDSARVGSALTLNLGIRYDHSRSISPDLPARDAQGFETGATIAGLGPLYTWDVVSPRLGLAWKVAESGRTILRSNYGRFYGGVLTGELAPVHPGQPPTTTARFDKTTGQYSQIVSVVDPTVQVRVDAKTQAPRTDQVSVSLDHELANHLTVTAAYVHKSGSEFIGWTDTAGIYAAQTRTLPDGRTIPVLALTTPTAARRFLLTNADGYFLRYNAAMFAVEKRFADRWQTLASYTLSRSEGLQASNGGTPGLGQFSSTFGNATTFGRDPNTLTNATGLLPGDRTHVFRVMGSFEIPRTGVMAAASYQYLTGLPWMATALVSLPQSSSQRVLIETRGSRRLASQNLLDLRVSKTLRFPGGGQVELLADVLNALDSTAEEGVADDNLFSQNFGRPTVFVDPRRVMFGVRLNLPW